MMSKEEIKELIAKNISGQGNQVDMGSALPTILNAMLENGGGGVTPITYAELKTMRDNGTLQAGSFYRITDYHTTTSQEGTQSADHQFDVIVMALTESVLSEEAYAIQHENDEYFSTSNLNAWKLMYCLDNDADRFMWADAEGKGVIFRMIDEYGNDCPYDFKNIMFTRTLNESGDYDPDGEEKFVYTFNAHNLDDDTFNDATLLNKTQLDDARCVCKGNVIKEYNFGDTGSADYTAIKLNDIVFLNLYSIEDAVYYYCNSNSFGNYCYSNSFGNDCYSNSFGNYVRYLTLFERVNRCNVVGSSGSLYVQSAQILNGTQPLSGGALTITFQANKSYTQVAGLNSQGVLKIWTPADNV